MTEQRTYVVPLRRGFQRTEVHQRSKKAVATLQIFLKKHMKTETVKLSRGVNDLIWTQGSKKPPAKITVVVNTNDEGVAFASLEGEEFFVAEVEEKEDSE